MAAAEGVDEYPYVLCQYSDHGEGKHSIHVLSELSQQQFEDVYDAQHRLRFINFSQMHRALNRAFDELVQAMSGEWTPSLEVDLEQSRLEGQQSS